MRAIKTFIIFIVIPVTLLGQDIPTITCDTTIKTSEFYNGEYIYEAHVYGVSYWLLKNDFKLYRGYTMHHPPSNNKELVGSWLMSIDGLIMAITKTEKQGKPEMFNDHRYKIFQFQWKIVADVPYNHLGDSTVLTSIGIVLTDNMEFNGVTELDNLNQYVREKFKPSELTNEEEVLRGFVEIHQVDDIVREYFYKRKISICVKNYRNNNLYTNGRLGTK